MARMNFDSMSVEELISTRDEIDALLSSKVADERRELQRQLSQLDRFSGGGRRGVKRGSTAGSSVAPKYISPEGETWAGRGARPRWLRAFLDAGREISEFAVGASSGRGRGKAAKAASSGAAKGRGRGRPRKNAA
jgi:DNA-binding protein H-NS